MAEYESECDDEWCDNLGAKYLRTNVHSCANFGAQMCQHMHPMCTERDDCMTMQMFVDALPRLAINSKYIDQFDCDRVQSQCDCWI